MMITKGHDKYLAYIIKVELSITANILIQAKKIKEEFKDE